MCPSRAEWVLYQPPGASPPPIQRPFGGAAGSRLGTDSGNLWFSAPFSDTGCSDNTPVGGLLRTTCGMDLGAREMYIYYIHIYIHIYV